MKKNVDISLQTLMNVPLGLTIATRMHVVPIQMANTSVVAMKASMLKEPMVFPMDDNALVRHSMSST